METNKSSEFIKKIFVKNKQVPLIGQIELTYRCNLNCSHCYSKNIIPDKDSRKELSTKEWKRLIMEFKSEGCLWLTFTGGEPLLRSDFLELYLFAKSKGFIVTIFTNGTMFTDEIINLLKKHPPFSIEITLNSIRKSTYEKITQVKGYHLNLMENIRKLTKNKLPLIIKTNCLKENMGEIKEIKEFVERNINQTKAGYRFQYDPMIYPKLDGSLSPCKHRLSSEELLKLKKSDKDIWDEYLQNLHRGMPGLFRDEEYLYQCDSWQNHFFVNAFGRLKFCEFTDKFSKDLKACSFRSSFNSMIPKLIKSKFKTNSKCKECIYRPVCYFCPSRAQLETGYEEAPVNYFCKMAKVVYEDILSLRLRTRSK